MARAALSTLGTAGQELIQADRNYIWVNAAVPYELDADVQENRLRMAAVAEPGLERDELLVDAVSDEGHLLEDEPFADWAVRPREHLEWARQEARLALARDRAKGFGRSSPSDVVTACEACLTHDPASEEATATLTRLYAAQANPVLVETAYRRCRAALEALGLCTSPALEEVREATCGPAPFHAAAAGLPAQLPTPRAPVRRREERRLVSVFFAEISAPAGFQGIDLEDLRDMVGASVSQLIAEVEGLGGTVTSVSGAGLSAMFGAPVSHEDDPERAVRAAYRALSRPGGLEPLSLRVGIETGPAIVGPIGDRSDYGAVGEVVSAAAAIQSVAKPGSALIGPITRAATERIFEWGPTDEVAPNFSSKPLVASYLKGPKRRYASWPGHARLTGHTPLVGREEQVAALDVAVRDATAGAGSVVFVVGEPGLGKTRLVQECRKRFMAWVGAASGRLPLWLEGRCASYASSTPYGLYQQLLFAWIGVTPEEGENVLRPALERAMRAVFGGESDHFRFVAHMMGLGNGSDGGGVTRLSPEALQRATLASVKAVVARLAAAGPTVLVLEDLHWADPTSLRLTEELAEVAGHAPLLLVATHRPEPDPGVSALENGLETSGRYRFRRMRLSPLTPREERELAKLVVGRASGEEVVGAVCTSAEGNPLFLEERFSSLVETGALVRTGAKWALSGGSAVEVPEVLERLIRSRVDRLSPGLHDVVVAASVLGTEFPLSALQVIVESSDELTAAVGELCEAGLLTEMGHLPEPVYRFRHALIQDATYKSLLRTERRQLHARAAWGLEAASLDRLAEVAAVLGYHYAKAGELERAVHHLEVAGSHASAHFANVEAISSYRSAIEIVDLDLTDPAMAKVAVALRAKLAAVLLRTGSHGELREVLQQAIGLVGPDDVVPAARLYSLLGRAEIIDHRYDAAAAALTAADGFLGDYSGEHDDATAELWLEVQLDGWAALLYWQNEPEQAAGLLQRARPVVESRGTPARKRVFYTSLAQQRSRRTRYRIDDEILMNARAALEVAKQHLSEDTIAGTEFSLGHFLLWHGDLPEAQEHIEAALATAERVGDAILRTRCLSYLTVAALRRHDVKAVRSLAPEALTAATGGGWPEYTAAAKAMMAWVAWKEGRSDDVLVLGTEALEIWASTVVSYSWYLLCLWPLLAVHLAAGRLAEAISAGRQLLLPPQQRLPDELEILLESALAAWERAEPVPAGEKLAEALELACGLAYA
jgi:class 3 adenylate cyclase/tetratricopeptide (TPR) repeat protein